MAKTRSHSCTLKRPRSSNLTGCSAQGATTMAVRMLSPDSARESVEGSGNTFESARQLPFRAGPAGNLNGLLDLLHTRTRRSMAQKYASTGTVGFHLIGALFALKLSSHVLCHADVGRFFESTLRHPDLPLSNRSA